MIIIKIEESWGFHISKIGQEMAAQFGDCLKEGGLESRHYGILLTVYNADQLTQIAIGERLSIDRTTVGQLIDQLETKRLIERLRNPADRRENVLSLTAKGKKLVENMWAEMRTVETKVISNLSNLQKETLLAIARQIKETEHDKN